MHLWKAIALQAAIATGTAHAADCERIEYLSVPAASAPKKPASGPKAQPGPRKPASVARTAAKPAPSYRRVITRYDCPPPSSYPPGGNPVIPGVPYVGTPPRWGYPPGWIPIGPEPLWPGTPNDFPPGAKLAPPSTRDFVPADEPVDVPEPPTWSMLLFGAALLFARRHMRRPTKG